MTFGLVTSTVFLVIHLHACCVFHTLQSSREATNLILNQCSWVASLFVKVVSPFKRLLAFLVHEVGVSLILHICPGGVSWLHGCGRNPRRVANQIAIAIDFLWVHSWGRPSPLHLSFDSNRNVLTVWSNPQFYIKSTFLLGLVPLSSESHQQDCLKMRATTSLSVTSMGLAPIKEHLSATYYPLQNWIIG